MASMNAAERGRIVVRINDAGSGCFAMDLLCIHPKQVDPIHRALQPTAAAIEWATRVLAAEAASPGAAKLDGRMVDRPIVLQAERILARGAH
jgi:citrate lyase beta subunit